MKTSKYSWARQMTAYESMNAWRQKRAAAREQFLANQSAAATALSSASVDQATEQGNIIARIAAARIEAENTAKAEALRKMPVSEPINTSRADLKDSMFAASGAGTLDSGTKIDLNSGTLTLSTGKTIDVRTGAQVYNFTV